jgi:hypothetical protein
MNTPTKVRLVAIAFVAISLINIGLLLVLAGPQRMGSRTVRLILTCLLAYFLILGKAWARYVALVISFLACITSIIAAFAMFPHVDRLPVWFLAWGFSMGLAYGVLGLFLAFSGDIRDYFTNMAGPDAAPNGGPAASADISGVVEGPPSVS